MAGRALEGTARPTAEAARTALRLLRRATLAFGVAALVSAAVRLLPHGQTPNRHGGWRELPPSEID